MKDLKGVVKDFLLREEFDVGGAFKFIKQKEGRAFPRKYILSALKSGDISKLSIPQDLGNDEELWFIYKLLYAPETLTEEDLHVRGGLDLERCTSLEKLPEGLSVDKTLWMFDCRSLKELPEGLSIGVDLFLDGCTSLERLPEKLVVGNRVSLYSCPSLQSLPRGLSVGTSLWLKRSDPISKRFGGNKDAIRKYIEQELGGEVKKQIVIEE